MLNCIAVPAGTGWTQLYPASVPSGKLVNRAVVEVGFCNGPASDVAVGLAVTTTSAAPAAGATTPASATCGVYEFARAIGPSGVKGNGPLTRALTVLPGQYVWVQASAAGVSATITGPEE
jgi:hypothetical protein